MLTNSPQDRDARNFSRTPAPRQSPGTAGVLAALLAETAIARGMMLAVGIYRALTKAAQFACAKCNHAPHQRCIFCAHPGIKTN